MAGFDYNSFVQFRNRFVKFETGFERWLYKFILNQGMRFISTVKYNTPVDTGDLRNHWNLDGITRQGDYLHCWFINPMNYANFVEYGHAKPYKSGAQPGSPDWVEGYFMMTISIKKVMSAMPSQFEDEFSRLIKRWRLM